MASLSVPENKMITILKISVTPLLYGRPQKPLHFHQALSVSLYTAPKLLQCQFSVSELLFCSGFSHLKFMLAANTNNFKEFKAEDKYGIMDHITQGSCMADPEFFDPFAFAMVNTKQKYGDRKKKNYLWKIFQMN